MKGVKGFGVKGKLTPRYIRPFPILKKCGTLAYKLDLPPSLARVHGIFHMLQLKKCLKAAMDVILPEDAGATGTGAADEAGRWGHGGTPSSTWEEHCRMKLSQPSNSLLPCGCRSPHPR
jgi:hypothetical protein